MISLSNTLHASWNKADLSSYIWLFLTNQCVADAILIPDPKNDDKKCGSNWVATGQTSKRTFELSDENFSDTECLEKCAQDQNCIAISSGTKPSGGKWCHGCKMSLDTYHPLPTTAFRKGK